ncbi:uncharacterized protein BX663DRAFT_541419 [Cokeromyces recurvatus]|uniref:uncharacterized protein n=1 Tax=Cokeromyces recurvatus TaxID=90255 RepID=UPI00221FB7D1|nr:uncharacterized protein BX663DRAFT_541419 [Cokeromyces recurvatus]KAI7905200.1 hypothetical protein BX663DRAFT_541419 [Cokeromyces recurvatus]
MLTLGQASCLVLDLQMTNENRQIAKKIMKESPFGVTYIYGTTYLEPVVIAKSLIAKNTYKYKHYPETPPGSPNLNPVKNEIDIVDENNDDHFGVQTQKKLSGNKAPVRGRSLYVLKKNIQENLNISKKCFKKHIQNSHGEWINIEYVRKSATDESDETRDRLVRMMVSKLINIGFREKIYVSPCSSAQDPIFKRDFEIEHKYGDGNTQDFLRYLSICSKKIRVCIISYAGLTTNTEDLQKFLSIHKKINEIVIIHDSNIEILERKALKKEETLKKFDCRTGTVPRSKQFKQ